MDQAQLYAKYKGLQHRDAIFVVENYLRLINWKGHGDWVLDVGCGDGQITMDILLPQLPHNLEKIVASDVSKNMVHFAKNKYPINNKVEFVQMDIATEYLPEEFFMKFDHIFSFYCLHWVQQQRKALKNIYNLLNNEGDTLLTFLACNPIYDIYERMAKSEKWRKYMIDLENFISPYHKCSNPSEVLEDLLHETGFITHVCRTEERVYTYPSYDLVKKSVKAVNPFIKRLPANQVDSYIDDYINELKTTKNVVIEQISNNETKIHCHYKLFVVFASKSNDFISIV